MLRSAKCFSDSNLESVTTGFCNLLYTVPQRSKLYFMICDIQDTQSRICFTLGEHSLVIYFDITKHIYQGSCNFTEVMTREKLYLHVFPCNVAVLFVLWCNDCTVLYCLYCVVLFVLCCIACTVLYCLCCVILFVLCCIACTVLYCVSCIVLVVMFPIVCACVVFLYCVVMILMGFCIVSFMYIYSYLFCLY
jgi:hypothetical protein